MGTVPISDRLRTLLTESVAGHGLDLEGVELTPAGKRRVLRVFVDQDGGVTLDDIADTTRVVSRALDETDVMGGQPYTLEVTSRGTDTPLTRPRHWRRNTDRLVSATTVDGGSVDGRIRGSDETTVMIETDSGDQCIAYADIAKARIRVEIKGKDR